jgi:hypothetical protein
MLAALRAKVLGNLALLPGVIVACPLLNRPANLRHPFRMLRVQKNGPFGTSEKKFFQGAKSGVFGKVRKGLSILVGNGVAL